MAKYQEITKNCKKNATNFFYNILFFQILFSFFKPVFYIISMICILQQNILTSHPLRHVPHLEKYWVRQC